MLSVNGPFLNLGLICGTILQSLVRWFGEESVQYYADAVNELPTFVADLDGKIVGFLSLKIHNQFSAEIYVVGVLESVQRQGVGTALVYKAEEYLREYGVEFLQVKTLGFSHPSEEYIGTREFYAAMGFRPLEEFSNLWGEDTPCLLMVKSLY